jgi:hypothetical protein
MLTELVLRVPHCRSCMAIDCDSARSAGANQERESGVFSSSIDWHAILLLSDQCVETGNYTLTFTSLKSLRTFILEENCESTRRQRGASVAEVICSAKHPAVLKWNGNSMLARFTFSFDRKNSNGYSARLL